MADARITSYQLRVLVCLALVNFVNCVDRQVVYPLFPLIARDFDLNHTQLAWLADRVSRKKVVSYAVFFWSGATSLSGLAVSFRSLVAARAHSTAMAIYYFWVNLCAMIPAAWVIGKIADHYDLMTGMYVAVASQAMGGICFLGVVYLIHRHGVYPATLHSESESSSAPGFPLQAVPSTDEPV